MITDLEASVPAIELPSIRAMAARWAAERKQEIADELFDYVGSGISSMVEDVPLARLARRSCLAIVELVLVMIEHAVPADRTEPPVVALEFARLMADRGHALEDLLRSYRLGHAYITRTLADAIMELTKDPVEQVQGVRETERFLFAFADVLSSKVGAAFIDQRQRVHRRTASMRRDVVRALLAGDDVDITRAEQSLGHSLTGPQLAFICWSDGDTAALQRAAAAMQGVLNAPRPVLLPSDDCTLSGWFDMSRADRSQTEIIAKAVGTAAPNAHVAIGPILPGLNGFRRSRAGAERARRVVGLSAKQPPTLTEWTSIALVDALSADLDAARELVRTELGALNRPGDHIGMLRLTARAFVEAGFSYAAAASSLHIHRNTALQRVKKAQALRGRPLSERPTELLAALALVDAIGPALCDH
jgi:DNA-binding PucR family transcriptional regulator